MTVYEILKFNRELLGNIRKAGIRLQDLDYIDLFSDFGKMVAARLKVSYIVAVLAEKYSVSERKVYSLIKRFRTDCTPDAV